MIKKPPSSAAVGGAGTLKILLKGSLYLFVIGVVANAVYTFLTTVTPRLISLAVDSVIGSEKPKDSDAFLVNMLGGIDNLKANMWILPLAVGVIALVAAVMHYFRHYINNCAAQKFMCNTRNLLFTHIQRLPLSWHASHRTGDLLQRCTSDTQTVCNFVSNQLMSLVRIVILIVFSLTFMFVMNWQLALIAAAFIPVFLVWGFVFHRQARKHFKKCDEEEGVLSTLAQENFTGVRVVKAFGREQTELQRFKKQNDYYTGLWLTILRKMTTYWTSNNLVAALQGMLMVVVGTVFCIQGTLTTGDFIAFITYNVMLMGPVRELGRIISRMSAAGVSLARISEILNAEEEELGQYEPLSGDIEFKDVCFSYEEGKPVLSGINLKVTEGTTLGILGAAGSGKSTLAQLLLKLYPLSGGDITVGGRSIAEISPKTLRGNIGLVLQESYIYSLTVGENIAVAGDRGEVKAFAQAACVDNNIEAFANGYDTVVGERGVTLSGGQKQRVAIARTLIRKTPYVIFDDSLSAVDSETDASIRENLRKIENCTAIMISHRITTLMHADKIVVIDGGKIAEEGSHKELLAKNGVYKKIYEMQMSLPAELAEEVQRD